ncbi:MAG: hypothetical protein IT437_13385 [Phycisphaerales bacterium]|nr:hypothetical protein [Phycisphaerales bacterium]
MAAKSKLTYRTLRLATIALGLACFHAYAQGAGPGGTGRVATVGRTGGSGNSQINTFTSRAGGSRSGVESYAGQRAARSRSATAARSPSRGPSAAALGSVDKKDVARALARARHRTGNGAQVIVASGKGRSAEAPAPEAAINDPVLREALARPTAPKERAMRNIFALSAAPTVAELMSRDALAAATAPRGGGSTH